MAAICEFCYTLAPTIPPDWVITFQSLICPKCMDRLEKIPNWIDEVEGGAFAEGRLDPRTKPTRRLQIKSAEKGMKCFLVGSGHEIRIDWKAAYLLAGGPIVNGQTLDLAVSGGWDKSPEVHELPPKPGLYARLTRWKKKNRVEGIWVSHPSRFRRYRNVFYFGPIPLPRDFRS